MKKPIHMDEATYNSLLEEARRQGYSSVDELLKNIALSFCKGRIYTVPGKSVRSRKTRSSKR